MRIRQPRVADAARPRRPRPFENLDNLEHLVDEGYLVAASALRLATKNGIILSTLRDERSWNENDAIDIARRAVDDLVDELTRTTERLAAEHQKAVPPETDAEPEKAPPPRFSGRRQRAARAERKKLERQREEAERLSARRLTMLGVIERLRLTRDDSDALRSIALLARDDTLGELVQARLFPRRPAVKLTEEQERVAIAGVKADLALLLDRHRGS
jgi:hypothetical protein